MNENGTAENCAQNKQLRVECGVGGKTKTERVARLLAKDKGYDPDALELGDLPRVDGYMKNGDPAHYMWRQFVPLAKKIIREASYP